MTLLSKVVKIADTVTKGLGFQAEVTLRTYTGDGGVGAPTYTDKKWRAVVEKKQRQVRSFSGVLTMSTTTVLFLDPSVTVKPDDRVTLPDGSGAEVIGEGGFVDKGAQLYAEVYLG